jgi:hypothetical protein
VKRRAAVCASLHAAALWTLWTAGPARAQAEEAVPEAQVKAAYLLKFLDFIEWPASAAVSARSPFVIGVAGADALADELAALAARRRPEARPVTARRLKPGDAPAGLHVLFLGREAGPRVKSWLAAVAAQPVLVVTETEEAFEAGAAIGFVMVDQRVRFDVALRQAEARELKISSRLLGVARRVTGAPT